MKDIFPFISFTYIKEPRICGCSCYFGSMVKIPNKARVKPIDSKIRDASLLSEC